MATKTVTVESKDIIALTGVLFAAESFLHMRSHGVDPKTVQAYLDKCYDLRTWMRNNDITSAALDLPPCGR